MKQIIDLTGRRVLVTGGGRGIGRAIALAMAGAGADVVVAARSIDQIESVASEIRALGRTGAAISMDGMSRESVTSAVNQAAEKLGGLDVLVNNAGGRIYDDPIRLNPLDHDGQAFEEIVFFNLTSPFYAIKAALPYMLKQKWGRIINIGSAASWNGAALMAYASGKHGLAGLTRAMAYSLDQHGISSNMVCPGLTRTIATDPARLQKVFNIKAEDMERTHAARCIRKTVLEPEEIAGMVAFLASDASSAINGQLLNVDGGIYV